MIARERDSCCARERDRQANRYSMLERERETSRYCMQQRDRYCVQIETDIACKNERAMKIF